MDESTRRRSTVWLALVPLVWLQLSFAAHQFDHAAEYVEDSCHVCVQLDRADDAAADHPAAAAIAPGLVSQDLRPANLVGERAPLRNFDSRGPPEL